MAASHGRDEPDSSVWSIPSDPGGTMQEGYPLAIFPSGCDDKFKCDICRLILREPLQGFCGHRFCKSCVEKSQAQSQQQGNPAQCRSCLEDSGSDLAYIELKADQMFPDNAVKREMAMVSVNCINPGCSWTGKFKQYPNHHAECPFQQISCDCGLVLPKVSIMEHQEKECPSRKILCKHCSGQIMFGQREEHNQSCVKFPVRCESCGKKKIPRDKLDDHLQKECPNARLQCPLGCQEMVEKSKMDQHLKNNISSHLGAVVEKINSLDRKFSENLVEGSLNSSISEIRNRVQDVESNLHRVVSSQATPTSLGGDGGGEGITSISQINQQMRVYEETMSVLHTEGQRCIIAIDKIERQRPDERQILESYDQKIRVLERGMAQKDVLITELNLRLASSELASYNGTLCWKISDWSRKRQEAITGKTTSIYSPSFYTDRMGYKMSARLYPNGDGMGKGSHLSLFFVLMRGNYDALLKFPFKQKVSLMLLDQSGQEPQENMVDAFRPDPSSSSFKRPTTEMNIASGCPLFMPLSQLMSSPDKYIRDDTVFIKVIVDCTGTVSAK